MTVPKPARLRVDNLPTVFPNAAGLDIGSAEIVAALPPDRDVSVVRTFTTFTSIAFEEDGVQTELEQWPRTRRSNAPIEPRAAST